MTIRMGRSIHADFNSACSSGYGYRMQVRMTANMTTCDIQLADMLATVYVQDLPHYIEVLQEAYRWHEEDAEHL